MHVGNARYLKPEDLPEAIPVFPLTGALLLPGGQLPLNTHGGLLSQAHLEGQLHITEAVKQLRRNEVEAERQVANAQVGIVSGHGGSLAMHATLILGAI